MFASRLEAGRLSLIASWPQPSTLFVAVGDGPYLVRADDPDAWSRVDRPTVRHFEAAARARPSRCCSTTTGCPRTTPRASPGSATTSDPRQTWLGRLDDEVHLRSGDRLHRVQLRSGTTLTESASW